MKYLLDTNICVTLIRQKSPAVLQRLVSLKPGDVAISSTTLAELVYGAEKSTKKEENLIALQQFVLPLEQVTFDQQAAIAYGRIQADLEQTGIVIGSMDMLIAANALSLDLVLVTNNVREFSLVQGLEIEDWISGAGKSF
jgi:tRNA(fMet)-specific endonuclease VapC